MIISTINLRPQKGLFFGVGVGERLFIALSALKMHFSPYQPLNFTNGFI
jgi:hypothetical protein